MPDISRRCEGCGSAFSYEKIGSGRFRKYCSASCRVRRWERMTGNRRMTCADCGNDMWRGSTSLPEGQARCLPCRRANPIRAVVDIDTKRERDRVAQAKRRRKLRAERGLPPRTLGDNPVHEWNCIVCGVLVKGAKKSNPGKYCSRHKDHYKGHRRRARKYGVHYEYINPRTIYIRDRWKCGLCGKRVNSGLAYPDPMSASLDHLIPMSAGGEHVRENVQCAHLACNMSKSAGGQGEQLALIG